MYAAIVVIIVTVILSYLDKSKKNNNGLILSFIIITIFGSIRYYYGSDYPSYLRDFNILKEYNFEDDLSIIRTELGWNMMNIIFKSYGFFAFVIFTTVIEQLIVFLFIKKYVNYSYHWLAVLCYTLNVNLMLLGFSMMRQFFAMCLFLVSMHFAIQRKWLFSILIIVVAFYFHKSAIILFPLCFAGYYSSKINRKKLKLTLISILFVFFLGGVLFGGLLNPIFSIFESISEYSMYTTDGSGENQNTLTIPRLFEAFVLVLMFYYFSKYNAHEKSVQLIYATNYIFTGFITVGPIIGRMGLYPSLLGIAAIPYLAAKIDNKKLKVTFIVLYIAYLLVRFVVFFNTPIWKSYIEYHTIFETSWE